MHSECLSPFPLKKPHRIFYHRFLIPASEPFPQTQFGLPNPLQLCPLVPTAAGRMRRTPPLLFKIESLPHPSMTFEGIFTSLCVRSVLVFFCEAFQHGTFQLIPSVLVTDRQGHHLKWGCHWGKPAWKGKVDVDLPEGKWRKLWVPSFLKGFDLQLRWIVNGDSFDSWSFIWR